MKRLNLVYGDAMLIYCIGCVDREDTIARFEQIIPHVGNEEVRAQMFVLKEKIDQYFDDEDWAIFFPKVLGIWRSIWIVTRRTSRSASPRCAKN